LIGGAISRGEFSSFPHGVFDPRPAAEFHFEQWTSVNGLWPAVIPFEHQGAAA
jgi:hypothetical protein